VRNPCPKGKGGGSPRKRGRSCLGQTSGKSSGQAWTGLRGTTQGKRESIPFASGKSSHRGARWTKKKYISSGEKIGPPLGGASLGARGGGLRCRTIAHRLSILEDGEAQSQSFLVKKKGCLVRSPERESFFISENLQSDKKGENSLYSLSEGNDSIPQRLLLGEWKGIFNLKLAKTPKEAKQLTTMEFGYLTLIFNHKKPP